jgi:hypothetical protein
MPSRLLSADTKAVAKLQTRLDNEAIDIAGRGRGTARVTSADMNDMQRFVALLAAADRAAADREEGVAATAEDWMESAEKVETLLAGAVMVAGLLVRELASATGRSTGEIFDALDGWAAPELGGDPAGDARSGPLEPTPQGLRPARGRR